MTWLDLAPLSLPLAALVAIKVAVDWENERTRPERERMGRENRARFKAEMARVRAERDMEDET